MTVDKLSESSEAARYNPEQRKLILAFARHRANPYQLLDHWIHGEPVRIGFTTFKRPELESKAWAQISELHRCSKATVTQIANYSAALASLLLFERLFPQDFGHGRNTPLTAMIADWDPAVTKAEAVVSEWAKNTHEVYSAWFDMRIAACVALSMSSVESLAELGFSSSVKKRAPRP